MKIAVIGGDKRMLFAAKAFADNGDEVWIGGFDDLSSMCEIKVSEPESAVKSADIIVLPVRPCKDDILTAPFSKRETEISDLMGYVGEKPVFTGGSELLAPYAKGKIFDYSKQEEFALYNAELTAEGAVGILLRDYERAIFGSKILVTGYGRIGSILAHCLKALGAKVTVAARRESARALASLDGNIALDYPELDYEKYDVVFNTVPAAVIDRSAVERMREDVFLVDLASAPGGMDKAMIELRGLSFIHALSLPGKTAPYSAGRVIRDTVMNIISSTGAYIAPV